LRTKTTATQAYADRATALRILRKSFATVEGEFSDRDLLVKGQIPRSLSGVLYRNGPGRMERGGQDYGHLFDGDGHIIRLEIDAGHVRYSNRFIRTPFFEDEERAGRILYRGLGTNRPGGPWNNFLRLKFKNAANTHVIIHGGRLLALYEAGPPFELDPVSLETRGTWDVEGALRNPFDPFSRYLSPLLPFAAHPKTDSETGDLIGFGLLPGRPNRLLTYRVDAEGHCVERRAYRLGHSSLVHDVFVTRNWMVFLLPQIDYGMTGVLFGYTSAAGSMSIHTERPMQLFLVPRDGRQPVSFPTVPGFVFHFAGGAEHADGSLHANLVLHSSLPPLDNVDAMMKSGKSLGRLMRLDINPRTRETNAARISEHVHEMPQTSVDGRHLYTCGVPAGRDLPFYSAILASEISSDGYSTRTQILDFFPDLPGEPIPVEADGKTWLLVMVYRAEENRTDLVILQASDLETVAEVALPHSLPPGFHGSWIDAGTG
jgi:all-trans-8'-apo-beta-carotenal 15,15'-oxygenase